jgi:hypothetical protein
MSFLFVSVRMRMSASSYRFRESRGNLVSVRALARIGQESEEELTFSM